MQTFLVYDHISKEESNEKQVAISADWQDFFGVFTLFTRESELGELQRVAKTYGVPLTRRTLSWVSSRDK
jgi:hypothetical protein